MFSESLEGPEVDKGQLGPGLAPGGTADWGRGVTQLRSTSSWPRSSAPGDYAPGLTLGLGFCWPKVGRVACMHAKSFQSCPTLCNPMDCSLLGSSVHGIL